MYAQVEKPKENKNRLAANFVSQRKGEVKQGFGFVDNRSEAVDQSKFQDIAKNHAAKQPPLVQRYSSWKRSTCESIQRYSINDDPAGKLSDNKEIFLDQSQDHLYAEPKHQHIANSTFAHTPIFFDQGDKKELGLSEVILKEKPLDQQLKTNSQANFLEEKQAYDDSLDDAYTGEEGQKPKDWLEHVDEVVLALQHIELTGDLESDKELVKITVSEAELHVKKLLDIMDITDLVSMSKDIQAFIRIVIDYMTNEQHSDKMKLRSECGLLAGMLLNVKGELRKADEHDDIEILEKAHPDVGEAYYITGKPKEELGVDFHYGTAIIKDGTDIATLEAYAPTMLEMTKLLMDKSWKWDMYGQKEDNETFESKHSHYFE